MVDEPNTPAAPQTPAAQKPKPAAAAAPKAQAQPAKPKPAAPAIPPADPNPALAPKDGEGADGGGTADPDPVEHVNGYTLPADMAKSEGAKLLLEACEVFGINPDPDALPPELGGWKFYPGNRMEGRPDSAVLVTKGGVKVLWYANANHPDSGLVSQPGARYDVNTETRLRQVFRAFGVDPKTKEVVNLPLPEDLTLPSEAVVGMSQNQQHVYKEGYLQSGGKQEAARRQTAKQSRNKR